MSKIRPNGPSFFQVWLASAQAAPSELRSKCARVWREKAGAGLRALCALMSMTALWMAAPWAGSFIASGEEVVLVSGVEREQWEMALGEAGPECAKQALASPARDGTLRLDWICAQVMNQWSWSLPQARGAMQAEAVEAARAAIRAKQYVHLDEQDLRQASLGFFLNGPKGADESTPQTMAASSPQVIESLRRLGIFVEALCVGLLAVAFLVARGMGRALMAEVARATQLRREKMLPAWEAQEMQREAKAVAAKKKRPGL